ncbi:MAG: hypothetical protein MMC33_010460, partial [Icmadophila ericetorum]|nr:hypothetical protein [Icmadophila ericetorum]
ITDVLGHRSNNPQLIADQLADNGYFVLMPDLFYGDPIPMNHAPDFDIGNWIQGAFNEKKISHLPPVIDPIIERCLSEMRTKYQCKKIGGIGYCFGGQYVVRYLKGKPGELDIGYTAHPSNVQVDELRQVKGPLAISAAENDYIFPTEKRHETEQILREIKVPYQINLYSGVQHGFAARCDLSDPRQKYAKEDALLQALRWFEGHGLKST